MSEVGWWSESLSYDRSKVRVRGSENEEISPLSCDFCQVGILLFLCMRTYLRYIREGSYRNYKKNLLLVRLLFNIEFNVHPWTLFSHTIILRRSVTLLSVIIDQADSHIPAEQPSVLILVQCLLCILIVLEPYHSLAGGLTVVQESTPYVFQR